MIDHDDALPSYLTESSPVSTQLIELIKRGKSEHELYQTREHMMEFANKFLTIDWGEIKGLVRLEELPGSERYFGSYITFLKKRAEYMREILNAELGIKQLSINFEEEKEKTEQEKNR